MKQRGYIIFVVREENIIVIVKKFRLIKRTLHKGIKFEYLYVLILNICESCMIDI